MPIININTNSTLADVLANPQSGSDNYALEGNSLTFNNVDLADQNFAQSVADTAEQDANTYSDSKVADSITNGVTTIAPSQNAVFDALALKQDKVTGVSDTEIGYLDGVTSVIQTQLDSKQNIPVNGYYGNPFFSTANNSILDSTSIFFGQVTSGANLLALSSGVPQVAGKVIGFAITGFNAATVGSNENCTIVFHYNNVANSTTISTTFKVSGNRSFYQEITGLNIDITSGNTCIELQTPALGTNPNAFRLYAVPIFKIQ